MPLISMIRMQKSESSDSSMDIVTLGERGQVVIPAVMRERLGLSAGDRLMAFTKHAEMICLVPASSMRHLVEVLSTQLAELDSDQNQQEKQ
jgi:AbrB family looped-hinge helix DNA binding protein